MSKLTWKIAVAGGAVAGISVGGFAIAQADDRSPAVDRVDPDAVAQASPVDPMPSPASTTIVADSARSAVADAVRKMAVDTPDPAAEAAPVEAPAPVDTPTPNDTPGPDTPADLDTPGPDTPDSPVTPIDQASPDSPATPDGVESPGSPVTPDGVDADGQPDTPLALG